MSVQQRANEVARMFASGFVIGGLLLIVASFVMTVDRVWLNGPYLLSRYGFLMVWFGGMVLAVFVVNDWLSGGSDG